MSESLRFVFKGNRNYVHGTSLFNAVLHLAEQRGLAKGTIDVSFKHMIRSPVCVVEERSPSKEDAVVARLSGVGNDNCVALCINEAPSSEQAERQAFDESEACRGFVLRDKRVVQQSLHHQDRIELLVSLCKKMHQECVDNSKKWVFSRYSGLFPIVVFKKMEIGITKQVGMRLTCSEVLVDDQKIGDIYFS